eukprot:286152_1
MAERSKQIIPKIGDVVLLKQTIATVMYVGAVHWNTNINELFVGLELPDEIPNGHSGKYDNTMYFKCKPQHGIILPITTIIKIISPQELVTKLSTFKTKLNTLNDENTKIQHKINELSEIDNDNDDAKHTHLTDKITNNFETTDSNRSASVYGLLLEKRDKNCKIQLKNIDDQLSDKVINVHEKYVKNINDTTDCIGV